MLTNANFEDQWWIRVEQCLFKVYVVWKVDVLEESILKFKCSWGVTTMLSLISKRKFWGQNFYKWGRNVILEPDFKGKLVNLCIYNIHVHIL